MFSGLRFEGIRHMAVADLYSRLDELGGAVAPQRIVPADGLAELANRRCLSFRRTSASAGEIVSYVPSVEAKAHLNEWVASAGHLLRALVDKSLPPRPGAVFKLPFPEGSDDDCLACFITDWSPFPAACAVAVHPGHVLARGLGSPPCFTGQYVRHPIHGDLLPVWVADWVAADIGTGAVIVNPAHSEVDLAYAREVGLPVRFGLVPGPVDTDRRSWPTAPVVKSGEAVRSGTDADGRSASDAAYRYLTILREAGWAREGEDRGIAPYDLGSIDPGSEGVSLNANFEGLLSDIAKCSARDDQLPSGQQWTAVLDRSNGAEGLATLVCLAHDLGVVIDRPRLAVLIGHDATQGVVDTPAARLAYIGAGAADESVSLKPEMIEQAERFVDNLAQMLYPADLSEKDLSKGAKRCVQIIAQLRHGDTHHAYRELYKLQRDLRKGQGVGKADQLAFAGLAYVFTGAKAADLESGQRSSAIRDLLFSAG